MITFDLYNHTNGKPPNPKQIEVFDKVMTQIGTDENGVSTDQGYRNFYYGGAIRGGKTFLFLFILVMLAKKYKGSRWHIIRATNTRLLETTIPSMKKLLGKTKCKWSMKQGDMYVQIRGGGRIYFMAEQFSQDKELDRFKGLETCGFLYEQIEELQKKTWEMCLSRSGSWYCDPMPPAFNFATFNPTYNWVKEVIYDAWVAGELQMPDYFCEALPDHNPHVTQDQWNQWKKLDPKFIDQFIRGNWDIKVEGAFFHAFQKSKHCKEVNFIPGYPLWMSFDFNVDPMTCVVAQTDGFSFINIVKEYRIENSNTPELCDQIKADFWDYRRYITVVGDAAGFARLSGLRGSINHYQLIMDGLDLRMDQIQAFHTNPLVSESRVFCNTLLGAFPNFYINDKQCPWLVKDLMFVEVGRDKDGKIMIKKTGMNKFANMDNSLLTHLSDCFRYLLHVTLVDYVKENLPIPVS